MFVDKVVQSFDLLKAFPRVFSLHNSSTLVFTTFYRSGVKQMAESSVAPSSIPPSVSAVGSSVYDVESGSESAAAKQSKTPFYKSRKFIIGAILAVVVILALIGLVVFLILTSKSDDSGSTSTPDAMTSSPSTPQETTTRVLSTSIKPDTTPQAVSTSIFSGDKVSAKDVQGIAQDLEK